MADPIDTTNSNQVDATHPTTGEVGTASDSLSANSDAYIRQFEQNAATNPTLSAGTQQTATLIQDQPGDALNTQGLQGNVTAGQTQAAPATQVQAPNAQPASTYDATLIGYQNAAQGTAANADPNQAATAQAAQGTVDPNSLIQNQMDQLSNVDENHNGTPDFAEKALRGIDEQNNARGLGSSTINTEAKAFGVLNALFPMASFNASVYQQLNALNLTNQQQANMQNAQQKFQTQMVNLSNDQQMAMQNVQNQQQTMLTDQSMDNASKQFNAQNTQQNNQFQASLVSQIALNNAARTDALSQFNAGQANALSQFNAQLDSARQQFNVENQRIIDQSNVEWRRSINTSNTAATNAANQANAQNLYNMSATAQANLWQQWRDEASWANTTAENDKTRAQNISIAAIQRDSYFSGINQQEQNKLYEGLGSFALKLLGL